MQPRVQADIRDNKFGEHYTVGCLPRSPNHAAVADFHDLILILLYPQNRRHSCRVTADEDKAIASYTVDEVHAPGYAAQSRKFSPGAK